MVAHNVVRIQGALPSGEVWSVNPKYGPGAGILVTHHEALLEWAQAIATLNSGNVLPEALRALISSSASVTAIRTEHRSASGELVNAADYVLPDPKAGLRTATKPHQVAWVSSLRTGRSGRSYRGRLYWPALAVTLTTADLRVPTATVQALVEDVSNLLTAIEAAVPAGHAVRLGVVSGVKNEVTPVTQISGGDVLDTQRRRRDTLAESYSSAPYAPALPPAGG